LPAQRPKTRALDLFKLLIAIALGVTTLSVKVSRMKTARVYSQHFKALQN
jgi:hypothetical protein